MTEQVLITGGAGFIGRALVRMLIQDSYRVTVLDDYRLGGKEFIAADLVEAAVWVEGDCRKATLIEELVAESTAVIHLAAPHHS
jgi:dTDP-L-rhamnose 4-epimerase